MNFIIISLYLCNIKYKEKYLHIIYIDSKYIFSKSYIINIHKYYISSILYYKKYKDIPNLILIYISCFFIRSNIPIIKAFSL